MTTDITTPATDPQTDEPTARQRAVDATSAGPAMPTARPIRGTREGVSAWD